MMEIRVYVAILYCCMFCTVSVFFMFMCRVQIVINVCRPRDETFSDEGILSLACTYILNTHIYIFACCCCNRTNVGQKSQNVLGLIWVVWCSLCYLKIEKEIGFMIELNELNNNDVDQL